MNSILLGLLLGVIFGAFLNRFVGVYTRKNYILLHFRTTYQIDHPRITKIEQLSARRFKHTLKLAGENDVNAELLNWLKDAYKIAGADA